MRHYLILSILLIIPISAYSFTNALSKAEAVGQIIKPSSNDWINLKNDGSWTFEKDDIKRASNRIISAIKYKDNIDSSFRIEYNIEVLGTGGTDGKGVIVRGKDSKRLFFTFGDDYPMGIRGIKTGEKKSTYLTQSKNLKIEAGKRFQIVIEVENSKSSMQVDGQKISTDYELLPPYNIELIVQRTGAVFNNVMIKKARKGDAAEGKDNPKAPDNKATGGK